MQRETIIIKISKRKQRKIKCHFKQKQTEIFETAYVLHEIECHGTHEKYQYR